MSQILDSGNRSSFASGAVRDIQKGKGRCDLMPLTIVSFLSPQEYRTIFTELGEFLYNGSNSKLLTALVEFIKIRGWDFATAMLEVSIHYEQGAEKYGERNWEKGLPIGCYINSAVRHLLKYIRGDDDEPHDRAFIWNLLCCMWTIDKMDYYTVQVDSTPTMNAFELKADMCDEPYPAPPEIDHGFEIEDKFEASKVDCDL